jgi:3-hydroxyethyl bacteriochlorophyllide a dehydrogenase
LTHKNVKNKLHMNAQAIIFDGPKNIKLTKLEVNEMVEGDVEVEVVYSGISSGTERLLWEGSMPNFPGMGYPLVPGYEAVGEIKRNQSNLNLEPGQFVFVPGAYSFKNVRNLFGGSGSKLVVPASRVISIRQQDARNATLLALAATAYHSVSKGGALNTAEPPDLIIGHGIMGRLLARMTIAAGMPAPTVWEINPARQASSEGYKVIDPRDDQRRDYKSIYDVSGDSTLLDKLIEHLSPGGEIVLAGFYTKDLSLNFAKAFMKEPQIRVAAQWKRCDLDAVSLLLKTGRLSLDGLITHASSPAQAQSAYEDAFCEPDCLKMILDWRI